MDEQDCAGAREAPGRSAQAKQGLHGARKKAAFPVEKEEREHADQRRQRHRQRDQGAEEAAAGELVAFEEKGQGNTDGGRQGDRRQRDPEARPESLPLGGAAGELGKVDERQMWSAERLGERQHERVADEPEERQRQKRSRQPGGRRSHAGLGKARGTGAPGAGTTRTRSPSRAASGAARTSSSPAASVATRK